MDPVASAGGSLKVNFTAHTTGGSSSVQPTVDGVPLNPITITASGELRCCQGGNPDLYI